MSYWYSFDHISSYIDLSLAEKNETIIGICDLSTDLCLILFDYVITIRLQELLLTTTRPLMLF
jgi:hypothetical protein